MKNPKKKRSRKSSNKAEINNEKMVEKNKIVEVEKTVEKRIIDSLMEAFVSVSLNEALSAYKQANGDANKAAEILGGFERAEKGFERAEKGFEREQNDFFWDKKAEKFENQVVSCSSSSSGGSSSRNSENWRVFENKPKKVIAATGLVSSVIGKEYVSKNAIKKDLKAECYDYEPINKADCEQFLCSMLGDDCELSLAVVRDVLCQCGYDVQKALDTLLQLSASSYGNSNNGQPAQSFAQNKEERQFFFECADISTDRASDSTSHTSENDSQDNEWTAGYSCRKYSEVLTGTGVQPKVRVRHSKSELSQDLLNTFFKFPNRSEVEPKSMNWKDVVKKMETLGQRFEGSSPTAGKAEVAKEDEYQVLRSDARQHWDVMKSCYHKAATAFSNGERDYASYLSEQGRLSNKMALEADEKASKEIFRARNKSIENVITIDLHGQHVKQAMRLLKVHLLFGAYACSIQIFRVITGCGGRHGIGKSKLKHSVIELVEREGVEWKEENRGTILIRLDGQRSFAFLEADDDSD